jgi:polyhydroxyalkanoate synthesis regulator phasin
MPTVIRRRAFVLLLLCFALAALADDKSLDQLKAEAERAGPDQAKLCAEVAERLVPMADKLFTEGESVKGHATVQEILQYGKRARELAISSRKKMKDTEIHLRRCRRALENMRRTLAAEDRPAVEAVEKQLEQFGEDILEAMFAPPKKDQK